METDKSATILEAQWMEREIPRIDQELHDLQAAERELLTAPLETVRQAYTDAYRAGRKRAHPFYHRRRSVKATGGGYRARSRWKARSRFPPIPAGRMPPETRVG